MKPRAPWWRRIARWLSLGGRVSPLALRGVHPDTEWAPDAPITRAAALVSQGDLAGARRALALLPVERLQEPTALLVQVCIALDAGELDTASALLLGWDKDPGNSPHIEIAMLWQFVQVRQQQPTLSPRQAFALAWRRVGQPDFRESRLLPPGPAIYAPETFLARLWSQPLSDDARVLVAITGEPNLEYGRFILEHLSDTRPPEFELALIEYLLPTAWPDTPYPQRMAALRPEASTALRAHLTRLAAASPDAMAPRFAQVLLASPDDGPFTHEEVDRLESLSRLPRWRQTDFASLYRYALQQLEVTDSSGNSDRRELAFRACTEAVALPMFQRVLGKLEASRKNSAAERQRLGLALQGISERMRSENTKIEQLVGIRMLHEGALLRGDEAADQQALALLQKSLDICRGTDWVSLRRWPLHSLSTAPSHWFTDNTSEFASGQDFSLGEQALP